MMSASSSTRPGRRLCGKTSRDEVRRNAIETALPRAYNQADVTLCGGRLCANIDESAQRFGDRKQYPRVKPRE